MSALQPRKSDGLTLCACKTDLLIKMTCRVDLTPHRTASPVSAVIHAWAGTYPHQHSSSSTMTLNFCWMAVVQAFETQPRPICLACCVARARACTGDSELCHHMPAPTASCCARRSFCLHECRIRTALAEMDCRPAGGAQSPDLVDSHIVQPKRLRKHCRLLNMNRSWVLAADPVSRSAGGRSPWPEARQMLTLAEY